MASDISSAADKVAKSKLLLDAFSSGDVAAADELLDPQAISHDPATPAAMQSLRGPEAFKRTVAMYRTGFPDLRMVVDDVVADGDKVVLRWHTEGTHRGELQGLAPTDKRGSVTGISIDQWREGKLVETWTQWDNLGLARQLGAAPPEGSIGERLGLALQHIAARRMRKQNVG
jgi:steroid delta-isomerase-like uncharacterized protein